MRAFMLALHKKYPETLIVSGGADGVDHMAEQTWLSLGGHVWSYRPTKVADHASGDEAYGVEFWDLGGDQPRVFVLIDEPTWATYAGAAFYRDWLIAETCDRLVAFTRAGWSTGTRCTYERAEGLGKHVYKYEREIVAAD